MKPASYFDILTKEATSGFASLAPASRFYLLLSCLFAQIEKNAFPQLLRSSTSVLVGMKKRGTRHSAKQLCLSPFDSSDNSKHQLIVKCPQQVKPPNFKIVPWSFKRLVQSRNWFFYRSLYMHDYHYPSLELNFEEGMDEVWGGGVDVDAITRPSCVCGEMDIAPFFLSLSLSHLHWTFVRLDRHSWFFQGLSSHKGFSVRIAVSPFFPTITMLDHHYTNGGALAFQGASIKEGKKSCSRRGEIHFVPGSNICCSRPSQKDARIKPEEPSDLL